MTNEMIEKIKNEISEWELDPYTDATFDEVFEDVVFNMKNYDEGMASAMQRTEQKIMDGGL